MAGLMGAPSAFTTTLILREAAGLTAAAWDRARRVDIERAIAVGDLWTAKGSVLFVVACASV